MSLVPVALLGVGLFASTNVGDLFLLVAWFASGNPRRARIVVGQYVGFAVIVAGSLIGSVLVASVARESARFLGLLPIAIAAGKVYQLRTGRARTERQEDHPARGVIEVATITLADCGDNLAVYTPAFGGRTLPELVVIAVVFAVMTGLWCVAAYRLATHPEAGAPFRRYADVAVPIVLVLVGLAVLCGM